MCESTNLDSLDQAIKHGLAQRIDQITQKHRLQQSLRLTVVELSV